MEREKGGEKKERAAADQSTRTWEATVNRTQLHLPTGDAYLRLRSA
jgi:hypothetical protein